MKFTLYNDDLLDAAIIAPLAVASVLGVSPDQLRELCESGQLDADLVGGHYWPTVPGLLRFVEKSTWKLDTAAPVPKHLRKARRKSREFLDGARGRPAS